jgi:hypothetical protein
MTQPQRYLTRALVFLGIVAITAIVLIAPISRAFAANPALNGLILGVLIAGLVISLRQITGLKQEVRWIEEFRRADSIAGITAKPRLLAPMAAMLGENRQMSLSALSMRTLLDGIAARIDEGRELSRYVIGLLIFLGLLGTFWGLLETIASIRDTIQSLSVESGDIVVMFDALKSGLEKPLSGMGTAFSSSLFGLTGSLVMGFVDLQAGQAQNRFFHDLEDWLSTVTKLSRGGGVAMDIEGDGAAVPSYVAALLEQTAESLDNLQRTITRSEEARGDLAAAVRALSERPEAVIDEATRTHLRNIDAHLRTLVEDIARGREQMTDEVRNEIKLLARTFGAALDSRAATSRMRPVKKDDEHL